MQRSIACAYKGVARNWFAASILKNHRVINGRQFEIDSEEEQVTVPSDELLIGKNKELLAAPSMLHYIEPSKICQDVNDIKYPPLSELENEEKIPLQEDESNAKYPLKPSSNVSASDPEYNNFFGSSRLYISTPVPHYLSLMFPYGPSVRDIY